jgi:N-acyl-D-aspartate/D-glutamate deacylase
LAQAARTADTLAPALGGRTCSGVVSFENGESTGELPGKLVRGPQAGA